MQLSVESDAHQLDRLAQGSLVSMAVDGVEGVDVNGGTPVSGLRSGQNYSIDILINECTGAISIHKVKKKVSPVLNFTVTTIASLFPAYVCSWSAASLSERRR